MNEERQDDLQAEARMDYREKPQRFKANPQERRWGNPTLEALRSERMNVELEQDIERHRRAEEYSS